MDPLILEENLSTVKRAADIAAGSPRLAEVEQRCLDRIAENDAAACTWAHVDITDMPAEGRAPLHAGRRPRHDASDASLPTVVTP